MQPFNLAQFSKAYDATTTTLRDSRLVDDLLGNAPNPTFLNAGLTLGYE